MSYKPQQYDTTLTEFTYTVARNAPIAFKRFLPEKIFRQIHTEKGAMRFANKSTYDEKFQLFSYLGVGFYIVFANKKNGKGVSDIREIFDQFETGEKPVTTLKKLAEGNIYICSDKELLYRLGHMAQIIDTKAYVRNQELVRASFNASRLRAKIHIEEHTIPEEEKEDAAELVKLFSKILWVNNICEETSGVDSPTMQILMYLYANRHAYVAHEKLMEEFAGSLSVRQLTASKSKLAESLMIQRHASRENNSVTITGRGILVVNQFRDKVIKMLNF